ncbi:MAG: methyltransferase domain-containing protein [Trueperaceae bacterium]|nr:methyltransferase domain-containing protein [Trueperaceae bacterium]
MGSFFRIFVNFNVALSKKFEKLFSFNSNGHLLLTRLFNSIEPNQSIADVGGGKKPAKNIVGNALISQCRYDGYDLSLEELSLAKSLYTDIYQLDLTDMESEFSHRYDVVICLNTLEHVNDVTKAIYTLSKMLGTGSQLYIKLPCKYAMFAQLNLIIPNDIKKGIMHKVYPKKSGDGFKVHYDKAHPNRIIKEFEARNFTLREKNLVKWSSYFSFFFPLYVVWRLITLFQNLLISDYCESFELIFIKDAD